MSSVPEIFGSDVFGIKTMQARLPKSVFKSLKKTMDEGVPLDSSVASVVANEMKEWAIEKGATHYTHWFQPLTGTTAEKHDSFISPTDDGEVIMQLSGKELIQGEPDASSFPSGGIRATFEARGYTAWDPTSPAFIKGKTLCIPTAFCSYTGEALDTKTPLLRSMEAMDKQSRRILKFFGKDVKKVTTTVGPEQEYFLIDAELYKARPDIMYCGRTLLGAPAPKGQELEDQYFASIKDRVAAFMEDLNVELWKLGIFAKTEHNEVAPAQHELAPIFTTTNIAADHNQLVMEKMRKVAWRHGLFCLLHEKPFDGVNGSGKHNNWSISTDAGENLLDPGSTPAENAQFLLFLTAVITAVDEYQDMLRISVATSGNDHRLGANEAPPAIISIFVGEELDAVITSIIKGETLPSAKGKTQMDIGVTVLPEFFKDTTDRNRTSPFAFTGNKFEFRMPGSSLSIAEPNIVLNTIVAEVLSEFADTLDAADDFDAALSSIIRDNLIAHQRILFNGNGYDDSWIEEAEKRGLSNYKSTPVAVPHMLDEKNVTTFVKQGVYSKVEMESRCEIALENYSKQINIEAQTMLHMVTKRILPACVQYSADVADTISSKKSVIGTLPCKAETELLLRLSALTDEIYDKNQALQEAADGATMENSEELALYYHDVVLAAMEDLRSSVDTIEILVAKEYWPYPSYGDLLFRV